MGTAGWGWPGGPSSPGCSHTHRAEPIPLLPAEPSCPEVTTQRQPEDATPAGAGSKFLQAGISTRQWPFPCKYQGEPAHGAYARPRHDAPRIIIQRLLR